MGEAGRRRPPQRLTVQLECSSGSPSALAHQSLRPHLRAGRRDISRWQAMGVCRSQGYSCLSACSGACSADCSWRSSWRRTDPQLLRYSRPARRPAISGAEVEVELRAVLRALARLPLEASGVAKARSAITTHDALLPATVLQRRRWSMSASRPRSKSNRTWKARSGSTTWSKSHVDAGSPPSTRLTTIFVARCRGRPAGFDRLVAALCAGQVGAVLCLDASRLAGNGHER